MAHKAILLDRDNTLIEDPGYLSDPGGVRLLPGVGEALRRLADAGYKLVVVTNQSAVARGIVSEARLAEIHAELERQLAEHDVRLDAIYYCPYHPEGTVPPFNRPSQDRKPSPGMLHRAARDLDIDLAASWMIGDSPSDIEAGRRAGCRTIRIRGQATASHAQDDSAGYTVDDLAEAAGVIGAG